MALSPNLISHCESRNEWTWIKLDPSTSISSRILLRNLIEVVACWCAGALHVHTIGILFPQNATHLAVWLAGWLLAGWLANKIRATKTQ